MGMANGNSSRLQHGANSPVLASTLTSEAQALRSLGRVEDAAKVEKRLKSIQVSATNPKWRKAGVAGICDSCRIRAHAASAGDSKVWAELTKAEACATG